jgi:Pyruvate/2-oxoacid:ferredoxin oxidoreductase gamma subunit
LIILAASQNAKELGDGRMANVVMLGALSALLPIKQESWQKALHVRLPKKYLEGNLQAFAAGQEFMQPEKVG